MFVLIANLQTAAVLLSIGNELINETIRFCLENFTQLIGMNLLELITCQFQQHSRWFIRQVHRLRRSNRIIRANKEHGVVAPLSIQLCMFLAAHEVKAAVNVSNWVETFACPRILHLLDIAAFSPCFNLTAHCHNGFHYCCLFRFHQTESCCLALYHKVAHELRLPSVFSILIIPFGIVIVGKQNQLLMRCSKCLLQVV